MRNESISLMTHFLSLVRAIRGPRATIAFEWPRFCDGWNSDMLPLIQELFRLLPYRADIDGCMHHVKSSDGSPILKPWRIQCTNPNLARLLTLHCDKSHFHVPCAGKNTAKTGFIRGTWPVQSSISILHASGSIMSQLSVMKCLHVQPPSGVRLHQIPLPGSVRTYYPPASAWPFSLLSNTCTHSWVILRIVRSRERSGFPAVANMLSTLPCNIVVLRARTSQSPLRPCRLS